MGECTARGRFCVTQTLLTNSVTQIILQGFISFNFIGWCFSQGHVYHSLVFVVEFLTIVSYSLRPIAVFRQIILVYCC